MSLEETEKTVSRSEQTEADVTRSGNPGKPTGTDGETMLERMNQSHFEVTGWGLSHWKIGGTEQILDIGCGGGATLRRMAEQVTTGHLTGLDYSEVSLKVSEQTNRENLEKGKMTLVHGSVEKLPFSDGTFDKIVTVESFYFWPDPVENLKEVRRVLHKNGTFLLIADIRGGEPLEQRILDNIERYHLFNPTPEEFRKYFESAGFADVQVHLKDGEHWICVEGHA